MAWQETTMSVEETAALAERYNAAWDARDLDGIVSLHSEDSVMHTHMGPEGEVRGRDTIREHTAYLFEAWPDMEFETVRLAIGPGFFVHETVIRGTLAQPYPLGEEEIQPRGQRLEVECGDVLWCADGLVQRKDSYLDAFTLVEQLRA